MSIRDNRPYNEARWKANQHWEMAGEARQDGDTTDEKYHTTKAREYDRLADEEEREVDPIDIIMEGGVIQEVLNIPKGMSVRVIDYDTDGADPLDLSVSPYDEKNKCYISEWPLTERITNMSKTNEEVMSDPEVKEAIERLKKRYPTEDDLPNGEDVGVWVNPDTMAIFVCGTDDRLRGCRLVYSVADGELM